MDRSLLRTLSACALLLSPTLVFRMGLDQGTYAYMAAELLEGRWPYIDTWDHQFPGGMVLQALQILLLGKSVAMFRVFDLVYQLANVALIYRITERVGSRAAAWLAAAIYCLIYQGYGPWNTGQREGFALLFVLWGVWLFLTADRRPVLRTAAGIGLGLGLALSIKPTFLVFTLIYLPLLTRTSLGAAWRPIAAAGVALAAPLALVIAFYLAQGALQAAYEAGIGYQTEIYVHRLRGSEPFWRYSISKLQRLGGNAVGLALFYLPFAFFGPALLERRMLYAGYLGSVFAVFFQGTFAGYHYVPGLGLGSILLGSAYARLTAGLAARTVTIGSWRPALQTLSAHVIVVLAIPVYVDPARVKDLVTLRFLDRPRPNEFRNRTVFDFTEDYDLAEYLHARTAPSDLIQVWGHESLVYYLADRNAASRFQTSNPLTMRVPGQDITPMQQRWRREFMEDMTARRPVYIVVTRHDNWWWAPEERTSEQLLDDFPAWKAFIQEGYAREHTIGRFVIYRRVSPDSRAAPLKPT